MTLPNLLIVGSQKCGTTWLHECLRKSRSVFGSTPKELNYFNRKDHLAYQEEYESHFIEGAGRKWRMESTPHYYQLPDARRDIAQRIHDMLGADVHLLVMLRDPVERYLSAYTHHMMMGRLPYERVITDPVNQLGLLSLGKYASITQHWQRLFPNMGIFFYDDLLKNRDGLVDQVMSFLDTENDITSDQADFLTNAKARKLKKTDISRDWPAMPVLSEELRKKLAVYYREEIEKLQEMVGRDISSWASLKV